MNGLAGFIATALLSAIALVAWQVGDERILCAALVVMVATLGFLVWNFPRGVIFAGDGGAYFLGFAIATLAVLLVHRNSEVSPWFALLALWYPVWETLYSMYRRRLRGRSPADPDGLHQHTLNYRRVMKLRARPVARRALTTLSLLALNVFTVVPAMLFWDETWILQAYAAGFVLVYLWLYLRIARFGMPLGQILGRKPRKPAAQRLTKHPGRT
jgi:UDP-N-acetylmuramyl pentapeptide phosphotransferase/UDP-N-acetylglucosamine-1-phosphate transferase